MLEILGCVDKFINGLFGVQELVEECFSYETLAISAIP